MTRDEREKRMKAAVDREIARYKQQQIEAGVSPEKADRIAREQVQRSAERADRQRR